MDSRKYEQLKEKLCVELEEITQREPLNAGDLDVIDKLTHTIKNIDKIMEAEEGYSHRGYSQDGRWNAEGDYYIDNGSSYRRSYAGNSYGDNSYGRMNSYRGRDAMGRYTKAADKEEMMEMIEEMISDQRLSADDRRALRKAQEVLHK